MMLRNFFAYAPVCQDMQTRASAADKVQYSAYKYASSEDCVVVEPRQTRYLSPPIDRALIITLNKLPVTEE